MKKKMYITVVAVIMIATALLFRVSLSSAGHSSDAKLSAKLKKPDALSQILVAYNNWAYHIQNNGIYMYDARTGNAGGEFPRGSGQTIVFSGGFFVGGLKNGTTPVLSQSQPSGGGTNFEAGTFTNPGVAADDLVEDDRLKPEYRVYLIDRTLGGTDYAEWPSYAPRDGNNDPALIADAQTFAIFRDAGPNLTGYNPNEDAPLGLHVGLETFVFNAGPLSSVVYLKFNISNVTNADITQTYIAIYMDPDVYNNGVHDNAGVDTLKGLGFVYNSPTGTVAPWAAMGLDFFQGPLVSPSDVPADLTTKFSGNDTILVYNPALNRYVPTLATAGQFTLGATGFINFKRGEEADNDAEVYNQLKGLNKDGTQHTQIGRDAIFGFPGDPITSTNCNIVDCDADGDDQRILHVAGPFTLAAGSTQEIWVGIMGATSSTSRLNALQQVYDIDALAQATFNAGLVAPAPPDVPEISGYTALDGRATIIWKNNAELTEDLVGEILGIEPPTYTETYVKNDFQGYRVYRSLTGLPGSYEMLAQYDKADGITSIANKTLNPNNVLEIEEISVGTDNGLVHSYTDTDVINGQSYFYSVTAYDAQPYIADATKTYTHPDFGDIDLPSGLPISLETSPTANVVRIIPMAPVIGTQYTATVDSVKHTGPGEGAVTAEIVDPSRVIHTNFTIEFFNIETTINGRDLVGSIPGTLGYRVKASGQTLSMDDKTDDPTTFYDDGDGEFTAGVDSVFDDSKIGYKQADVADPTSAEPFIVEGIKMTVFGPALDFKRFVCVSNGSGALAIPDMAAYAFNGSGFPTLDGAAAGSPVTFVTPDDGLNDRPNIPNLLGVPGAASVANGGKWGVHTGSNTAVPADFDFHYANFLTRVMRNDNFSRLVPYDFEMRFTAAGSLGFWGFGDASVNAIPFELWRVGIGTYSDASDDVQMVPLVLDDGSATDVYDMAQWDHSISGGDNDPYMDWVYWYVPDDETPGSAGYNDFFFGTGDASEVMARTTLVNFNAGQNYTDATWPTLVNQVIPATGTTIRIISTKPSSAADTFKVAVTGNSITTAKSALKKGLKDIKVVPNPYFGRSDYQQALFDKTVKFINLPAVCTIKIFTVAGDLVDVIRHNASSNNDRVNDNPLDLTSTSADLETSIERWDLRNFGNKFVASGMYVALIEAPGIGKKTVKFAIIQEEVQFDNLDQR